MQIMRKIMLVLFLLTLFTAISFSQLTFGQDIEGILNIFKPMIPAAAMALIVTAAAAYLFSSFLPAEWRARVIVWSTNMVVGVILALIIWITLNQVIRVMQVGIDEYANQYLGWGAATFIQLIGFSLALGIVFTMIFYLAAYFSQHPPLYAMSKEFLASDILTIVIVAGWLLAYNLITTATVGILCTGAPDLCIDGSLPPGTNIRSHVDLAYASLDVLFLKMKSFYTNLYLFEVLIGFLSTVTFPLGSPLPAVNLVTISFTPFDGLVLLSNAHTVIVEAIGYMMTLIMAKQFILDFARNSVPFIIFPLGIFMRAFPFFRMTGSSLIAIGIVTYFVYPLAILFTNYLIFDVYKPKDYTYVPKLSTLFREGHVPTIEELEETERESRDRVLHEFEEPSLVGREVQETYGRGGFFASVWNVMKSAWGAFKGFISTVVSIYKFMFGFSGDLLQLLWRGNPLLPTSAASGLYRLIIEEVVTLGSFVAIVLLTSIVELVITITMYRNIAAMIGGEVEVVGLAKLV